MMWWLAIDFGTTCTSAAMLTSDGRVQVLEVDGVRRMPSAVSLLDGELTVGRAAEAQAAMFPAATERNPKRYLGIRPHLTMDGQAVSTVEAVGAVLKVVADEARRHHNGAEPAGVLLTHPARWSTAQVDALREAAAVAGLHDPKFMAEPVAAALHYASEHVSVGDHVGVYDLGGGTFDTAVLQRTEEGFELSGPPGGDDRLGGEDFDLRLADFLVAHLATDEPDMVAELTESDDPQWLAASNQVLWIAREAKEALSRQTTYRALLPAPLSREVRITRPEFEALIRGDVQRTIDEFGETVRRAGLQPDELSARYLTGGSSRIPLIGRLLTEALDGPPDTYDDPKIAVAIGAAKALGGPDPSTAAPAPTVAPGSTEAQVGSALALAAVADEALPGPPDSNDEDTQTDHAAALDPEVAAAAVDTNEIDPSELDQPAPPEDTGSVVAGPSGSSEVGSGAPPTSPPLVGLSGVDDSTAGTSGSAGAESGLAALGERVGAARGALVAALAAVVLVAGGLLFFSGRADSDAEEAGSGDGLGSFTEAGDGDDDGDGDDVSVADPDDRDDRDESEETSSTTASTETSARDSTTTARDSTTTARDSTTTTRATTSTTRATTTTTRRTTTTATTTTTRPPLRVSVDGPGSREIGQSGNYSVSVDNALDGWSARWDWGNGVVTNGNPQPYNWSSAGTFTVVVTVTDGAGRSDSASMTVQVVAASLPAAPSISGPSSLQGTGSATFCANGDLSAFPGGWLWGLYDGTSTITGSAACYTAFCFGINYNYQVILEVYDASFNVHGRQTKNFSCLA